MDDAAEKKYTFKVARASRPRAAPTRTRRTQDRTGQCSAHPWREIRNDDRLATAHHRRRIRNRRRATRRIECRHRTDWSSRERTEPHHRRDARHQLERALACGCGSLEQRTGTPSAVRIRLPGIGLFIWLKSVLVKCGVKPINNIVDITNYISLIFGQPRRQIGRASCRERV